MINQMDPKLKVEEFDKKQDLLDYVNQNLYKLKIVTISSTQVAVSFRHFLWYYDK